RRRDVRTTSARGRRARPRWCCCGRSCGSPSQPTTAPPTAFPGPASRRSRRGEDLRDAYELDSLDFLALAETLSAGRGARIDEEDYPELVSVDSCLRFLTRS
ncbi:MAG: hypothetical protein ACTHJ6_03840, partial [Oryzihumus sp.]